MLIYRKRHSGHIIRILTWFLLRGQWGSNPKQTFLQRFRIYFLNGTKPSGCSMFQTTWLFNTVTRDIIFCRRSSTFFWRKKLLLQNTFPFPNVHLVFLMLLTYTDNVTRIKKGLSWGQHRSFPPFPSWSAHLLMQTSRGREQGVGVPCSLSSAVWDGAVYASCSDVMVNGVPWDPDTGHSFVAVLKVT